MVLSKGVWQSENVEIVTRFAPSPNGNLHLGHAYSAIYAHDLARDAGGHFLMRIEDIDGPRSQSEFADEFRRDLEWLGLDWDEVPAQSTRFDSYDAAAKRLLEDGWLYRCSCNRKDIEALEPRCGADGFIYPGSCKGAQCSLDGPEALRLDINRMMAALGECVWTDEEAGSVVADPREFGDVVIVRKDLPASYHLAATLDDAVDGVTAVTRGEDLFTSTHVHRYLQELLKLPVPHWHHHKLLLDDDGQKLAKRRGSPSLKDRREAGEDGLALAEQLRLQQMRSGT
ncbi:tRNA glutamyl-Q(34) synthetase GluQRS [Erythrobacter crassostreae]|uniref:tRNA glutamyl-Q(34) synthetase GluQRS n=1 Tax=Erythrobacter crassostreae TaxID=2828328 RepID=A0A9X1F136_9SPHN|nr:tRNA glutamyl-Q(34) synthetase GluQRS [Erythrobacter crassostrea]MBV7258372.1 tRNA glutamyl-Q(34) synthetase GluQRS [Erythrobacter crassostrea]